MPLWLSWQLKLDGQIALSTQCREQLTLRDWPGTDPMGSGLELWSSLSQHQLWELAHKLPLVIPRIRYWGWLLVVNIGKQELKVMGLGSPRARISWSAGWSLTSPVCDHVRGQPWVLWVWPAGWE
jgi:hypothetical protein